jgi:pleiotropic regulator 1
MQNKMKKLIKPDFHPQWKLMRVISGHQGWVRALAVDPSNQVINSLIDSGSCRGVMTGLLSSGTWPAGTSRSRSPGTSTPSEASLSPSTQYYISSKYTYLYSVSEDKTVKCWDLEYNKIIRNYHGHLSGVYCVAQHPTLDLIFTGGRDATVRVWDIRTRN